MMDPNKRGNPPFEPSSYAAGLERRVKRHEEANRDILRMADLLVNGSPQEFNVAYDWFEALVNQPEVVCSSDRDGSPQGRGEDSVHDSPARRDRP
jgi:hypothetical protein